MLADDNTPEVPAAAAETPLTTDSVSETTSTPDKGVPEALYASIGINEKAVGTFLVVRYPDGDFAVRADDLANAGIEQPSGQIVTVDGQSYLLLSSLAGASFHFDERRVHIAIEVDPESLRTQTIDARRRGRSTNVIYPRDTSAFFNYALSHDDIEYASDTFSGEAGLRYGDFLLLSDGFYEHTDSGDRSVRLRTSLTHDNRETLQRTIIGDFTAASGALGSALNMGGISFSKNYRIDPYLIRYPYASYSGIAPTPSRYEVYVNGTRVSSGALDPGPFDITNIQGPLGVSDVQVVVRDAFGRELAYSTPFYFTQAALRRGMDEYSVAVGSQREQFGVVSNEYGSTAANGFYRFGISDTLTLGGRSEAADGIFNLGPNITVLAGRLGLFNSTLSYSNSSEGDGYAGLFDYAIQTRKFNATVSLLSQSRNYARIGVDPQFNTRLDARTAFSFGPFTLSYATTQPYQGVDRTVYGVSATPRTGSPRLSVYTSLRRIEAETSTTEFYVGINYYFRDNYSIAGAARTIGDDYQVTSTIQKGVPTGEGWGFSAQAAQFEDSRGEGHSIRPFVQYNGRYATLVADYQKVKTDSETTENERYAIQGSISALGGNVMLSRPITDAFALVQVDGLEGVRVYQSGQYSGSTDKQGRLLVPSLGSYVENQIAVDNRDVPLDFELRRYTMLISPALRGGAVLDFGAKRIRAVAGTLKIRRDGETSPVAYGEVSLVIDDAQVTLPVGHAGEFFIERLETGSHTLSYTGKTGPCSVALEVPESDDAIIELGNVLCVPE